MYLHTSLQNHVAATVRVEMRIACGLETYWVIVNGVDKHQYMSKGYAEAMAARYR